MLNRLFFRLFLAFWLLSAGVLFFSGIYITRTVEKGFTDFVSKVEEEERQNLVDEVASVLEDQSGSRPSLAPINHLAHTQNVRIIVEDHGGDVIHDTHTHHTHHRRKGMHTEEISPPPHMGDSTHPLVVRGSQVGEVTIVPLDRTVEAGYFTPLELAFKSRITDSILWGGMISLFLSAVISAVISGSISRPVNNLKKAAEELKQGKLHQRAFCKGPREIEELSQSFNSMADHLEKSYYLKKKFTQDVSHELRNPVSTVKGYLEAFQDGVLLPDREQLGYTLEEIYRLEKLVEEVHRLALADFNEVSPHQEKVDLQELGDQLNATVKPLLEAQNLEFNYFPPGKSLAVIADPGWLKAAVKNLLRNALNYTPEGGRVELSIVEENFSAKEEPWAVISVSDNGEGIPEDKLPYIFERFYRADDSRARETGGSGLGLSLVREWTRAMGGEVQVFSREGKGSTFKLVFPLANHLTE